MLRVLVIDDHVVVREGLKRIIEQAADMRVVGEAGEATQALLDLGSLAPDVVVLDLDLPGRAGLDLLREIKSTRSLVPVLILSFYSEEACGVAALRAGADGYLVKESSTASLVDAIRKVAGGGKFVSARLAELLARAVGDAGQPRHALLSEREFEVLRLVGMGLAVSEIAGRMALSVKTVSTYRRRVLDKMGMHNNAQLTHYAIEHRLVTVGGAPAQPGARGPG